ncbi:hypothetical protein TI10_05255 [Photorhabdus luminescens subsp. luminescens]|uniref:Uncharacterized protein n=1 Tax=Photorhabdus luminescens TaxID=29488 RepID=A0A1G5Q1X4_PHOLU|nr:MULTISPECIES: hypothetical protein [Photorhabdus]KMW73661.1 hypothetical protein TI10_05255 [Photorhabdus luminescens subsp. luminescens]MCT8341949.1 hypothetical protein [Photorhabdus kleinii]RAW93342.1 hypothetical protein CKY03_21910 [Photorhabdus sp. S9-53]RAW93740.1 hypothetical protein CKY05_21970 [Photorhabdus sp. S10-54]RAW97081.1 hypothetical protein CKY04_21870 [Photorhabdus sp. S8-52]
MATVIVGCKLPHGLTIEIDENRVTLNGINSSTIIGGYGLTYDVDKAFFDKYLELHADTKLVKNGLIFAQEKLKEARTEAEEKAELKNGLEPIDPKKPGKNIEQRKEED